MVLPRHIWSGHRARRRYRVAQGLIGPAETITLEEVFALAGVPLPDTSILSAGPSSLQVLIVALFLSSVGFGGGRFRTRSARDR